MTSLYVESPQKAGRLFSISTTSFKSALLFFIFFLSLQKFSVELAGSVVSTSYFYLLLLLIPIRRISITLSSLKYIFPFCIIFIVGIPEMLLFEDPYYQMRTTASFLVFISPLSLLFIQFKKSDLELFIYAVILSSLCHSMNSIAGFALHHSMGIFALKAIMGSQRYGFVLCLGFFMALYDKRMGLLLKGTVLTIIFGGMLLTFSRSTVVSTLFATILIIMMNIPRSIIVKVTFKPKSLFQIAAVSALIVIAIFTFQDAIGQFWYFFDVQLFGKFASGEMLSEATSSPTSSEGMRVYLFKQILEYVSLHPLFGSSFSGLYLLFKEYGGSMSAHNQYTDVLLRTGLIGFGLYCYLIAELIQYFRKHEGIFFGFIAVLIYGLMHETFKIGYGAFIFGFLLSYQFWMRKPRSLNSESLILDEVKA
jgi:hypothetical protein